MNGYDIKWWENNKKKKKTIYIGGTKIKISISDKKKLKNIYWNKTKKKIMKKYWRKKLKKKTKNSNYIWCVLLMWVYNWIFLFELTVYHMI